MISINKSVFFLFFLTCFVAGIHAMEDRSKTHISTLPAGPFQGSYAIDFDLISDAYGRLRFERRDLNKEELELNCKILNVDPSANNKEL